MSFDPVSYFKTIAEKHKSILHNDATNKAFFEEFSSTKILFDNADFLQQMRTASNTIMVVQFNGDINYAQGIDNNNRTFYGAIFLLKKIKINDFENIKKARTDLISIWDDIFAKIKNDISYASIVIRSPDAQISAIGMIADNYFGIAINLSYEQVICSFYNSDIWQET